ncbi:MAG: peptide chain release factor N(5)-glutamine methyltransferase [Gammaproteobacteria bacterium]|nr:peptide chain release factor N(5)-glutamine methyltransferase [Gammaproteobacteria bacterium]
MIGCEPARADSLRCGELVRQAAARLEAISDTPKLDAELLVAHAAGATRSAVIAFPERALDMDAARRLDALIERRAAGEPLAYLVGEKEFYSLALAVSPAVLVPRPETEHLVDAALARLANVERPSVLDLGTGSGALALAIKHERRDAIVVGADASADALTIARANGERLGLEVEWLESDWFAALAGRTFDCIVCNPPYLASDDPHFARLGFEPRAALDGGPDGLYAIRRVLADAPAHLDAGGVLILEHGYTQQDAIIALAARCGLAVLDAGRDLEGRPRYVVLGAARR